MSIELPIIRLDLEFMKGAVLQHLKVVHEDIEKHVEAEIENAICAFDFKKTTQEVIRRQLKKSIENYFEWGQGKQDLEAAVTGIFKKEANL